MSDLPRVAVDSPLLSLVIGVQFLGILSACVTRMRPEGSGCRCCRIVFMACLLMVGASIIGSFALGPGYWVFSSGTFCAMVLAATWDLRCVPAA